MEKLWVDGVQTDTSTVKDIYQDDLSLKKVEIFGAS